MTKDKNCLNCEKPCKEEINPELCYCDEWSGNMNYKERINIIKNLPDRKGKNYKNLNFQERAKLFKESVERVMKKYNVKLTAGYINSMDDSENLIIEEIRNDEVINEVYFDTLRKEL